MNSTLRWTIMMAILGFILGLGFLIPLPGVDTREPASVESLNEVAFIQSEWTADEPAASQEEEEIPARPDEFSGTKVDHRRDVLFDIHTISQSAYAKNADAYVVTRFRGQSEIDRFTYCHNYDYKTQRARGNLNRYSVADNAFDCYAISLKRLIEGYTLIDTPLGTVLSLKAQRGFNPKKGGTISILFAYHVAKVGRNDYRQLDLHLSLVDGVAKVSGPRGEPFDWLNLKMSEDRFNLPNGVRSFELYSKDGRVSDYVGDSFPKPRN